jgi:hypothetical protein
MKIEVRAAADREACIDMLRKVERHACEPCTAEEMAEGCTLLDVLEDGRTVGAAAVEVTGGHATIRAATASGAHSWAEFGMFERMLRDKGVRTVGLLTRRRALVERLTQRGYRVVSVDALRTCVVFEMQKELSRGQ